MRAGPESASLLELPALVELINATPLVGRKSGEALFHAGESCTGIPILLSGTARVYTSGNSGRQVTLYRLKPGEVCPVSLSALLQQSVYPAAATAETPLQVRYLAGEDFRKAISQDPETFSIFLNTFAGCLYDSVCLARQLMFDSLEVRLANLLYDQLANNPEQAITLTHEEIARELGTTRVVASRMLKKLEHADCIRLRRRQIALNDVHALKEMLGDREEISNPA